MHPDGRGRAVRVLPARQRASPSVSGAPSLAEQLDAELAGGGAEVVVHRREGQASAKGEFQEETGVAVDGDFMPLSPCIQNNGKLVCAWAVKGDLDADGFSRSNGDRCGVCFTGAGGYHDYTPH